MSDSTLDLPRNNVRDIILFFEQKSVADNSKCHRPRSSSIGVINENTTVRCDDLQTLEDVEEALTLTDTYMQHYLVYNEDKHVSFLEQLFNILTCAINIESETKNDRENKKRIISRTKELLVFLHSKVPLPNSTEYGGFNHIPYTNGKEDSQNNGNRTDVCVKELRSNFEISRYKNNRREITVSTPIVKSVENLSRKKHDKNNNESLNVADESSIEKEHISVKELKANFELHQEIELDILSKKDKKESPILIRSVSLNKSEVVDFADETDESLYTVSVNKLRTLFEEKSRRSSKLQVVVNESPKYQMHLDKNIPYTNENLAFHRLKRAHSGYYLDYLNLIKMANLCKSVDRIDLEQIDHSVKADGDDVENTRESDDFNESDRSGYTTADEFHSPDEDNKHQKATEINIGYKSATIEPVNKEEVVKTEDNNTDGKLQFKEIEIEELDDVEDSKIEDDLSQIEAKVIETDDNDEDMDDGSIPKADNKRVEEDIEIVELETQEPIYEAEETEYEVHHGSAAIIDSKEEVSFSTLDCTNTSCDIYSALTPEDEKNAEEEFEYLFKAM